MNRSFLAVFLVSMLFMSSCKPPAEQQEPTVPAVVEDAVERGASLPAVNDPFASFDTSISVKELMNAVINLNARQLWNGVSYVESAEGIVEKIPETQEDWDGLEANAIALIEGSNALMLPGRKIEAAELPAPRPDFQYSPAEIAQLLRENPDDWLINLQTMQESVQATLEAIRRKDIFAFTERGAAINDSCEACHAQYWYKPLPMSR